MKQNIYKKLQVKRFREYRNYSSDTVSDGIKKCEKKKYDNLEDAKAELNRYLVTVLFSNMCVYWCEEDESFHLGHDRYMTGNSVIRRYKDLAVAI